MKKLPVQTRKPETPEEWRETRAPTRRCPKCGGWQRLIWGNGGRPGKRGTVPTHWRHLAANTFCQPERKQ